MTDEEFSEVWAKACREANETYQHEYWWRARDFLHDRQAMAMFRLVARHAVEVERERLGARVFLARVLEAKAQWDKLEQEPIATARQVHEHDRARARFATLAAYYFEQNRAALERMELEP